MRGVLQGEGEALRHRAVLYRQGFHGCYECDDFRACDRLATLEDLHGDSCVVNLESIRRMGPEAWVAEARRFWFGSDVDDPPSSE